MIRALAFLAMLIPAAAAGAAPVTVRSGEHPGFSRLVLYTGQGGEWRLGRDADGYELRVAAPDGFDLSDVWRLIPRDRIAAIDPRTGGRLHLALACDCHALAFEIPQGLVIDIHDGPPPPGSAFEQALNAAAPAAAVAAPAVRVPGVTFPDLPMQPPAEPAALSDPAGPDPRLVEAQARLAEQLARAAAQGVIRLEAPPAPPAAPLEDDAGAAREEPVEDLPPPPPDRRPAEGLPPPPAPRPADHLSVRTVIDRDAPAGSARPDLTAVGDRCIPPEELDLASWAGSESAGASAGIARAPLIDESGNGDPRAIEAAARRFVALGFGAEARALLGAFPVEVPSAAMLDELGRLVDGDPVPDGLLAPMMSCEGPAALWAVLARGGLRPGDPVADGAVIAAFAALPPGLRRSLGPGLAAEFLAIGDADTAASLRNALARATAAPDPGLALLEARMAADRATTGSDRFADLAQLAAGTGPDSAAALVELAERLSDAGAPMPPDLAERAAARAREHLGTPLGAGLLRAEILARSAGGDHAHALALIDRAGRAVLMPETDLQRLRATAVAAAARDSAALPALLPALLAAPLALGNGPSADAARRGLAETLLEVGLPGAAREVLSDRPDGPAAPDRMLLARAWLAEDAPETAFVLLVGLEDAEAERLRAEALLQAGEGLAAAAALERLDATDAAAVAAWRAGDWERAARLGSGAAADAAALALQPAPQERAEPEEGALARTRAILRASTQSRMALDALLRGLQNG